MEAAGEEFIRPDIAGPLRPKCDLSNGASIAEIRWAAALVRARIAITFGSVAPEAIAWRSRLVSREGGAREGLVKIGAALSQRVIWGERSENQKRRQAEKESMTIVRENCPA